MRSVRAAVITALVGGMGVAAGCGDADSSVTKSPGEVPNFRKGSGGSGGGGQTEGGSGGGEPIAGGGGSGGSDVGGGGGQGGGFQEPPTLGPGSCQIVSLQSTIGSSLSVGLLTALDAPDLPEALGVSISIAPALPAPGVYGLGSAAAKVTASIFESGWFEGAPYGYVAETGYAVLEQVDSGIESKGAVKDVRLRRCNWTYTSTPEGPIRDKCVPDITAPCVYVASYDWDSIVPEGTPCAYANQCGDTSIKYCDPLTKTCKKAECHAGKACGEGLSCTNQIFDASGGGLCRKSCVPKIGADACASGEECVSASVRPTEGMCLPKGVLSNGQSCDFSSLAYSTQCSQPDSYCASGPGECAQMCTMFGEGTAPICPLGQFCRTSFNGTHCGGNEYVSPAQVGQPCGPDYFVGCAPGFGRLNGFCLYDDAASDYICRQICKLGGPPCPSGTCVEQIDGYVGACLP